MKTRKIYKNNLLNLIPLQIFTYYTTSPKNRKKIKQEETFHQLKEFKIKLEKRTDIK